MGREIKRVSLDFDYPGGMVKRWHTVLGEGVERHLRREPPEGEGWQVWETVSEEGSPVSPVFATAEGLALYLSEKGDSWHQERAGRGIPQGPLPTYEQALAFVKAGWAPSAVFSGGRLLGPYQAAGSINSSEEAK